MYNTRRSSQHISMTQGNSVSEALEIGHSNLQNWIAVDNDYASSSCPISQVPIVPFEPKVQSSLPSIPPPLPIEQIRSTRRSTRKRANATVRTSTRSSVTDADEEIMEGDENKRIANKICRVCGDKAFSYNFNVITCESCKAFFRRNANREKEIRCPFNEKCEINMVSRRFCQRCRLDKCFNVGMKKEWIMSEEARLEKKMRVEENRERRLQDALNRAIEEANENAPRYHDSPTVPYSQNMTVREYVLSTDERKQGMPTQSHQTIDDQSSQEQSDSFQSEYMKDDKNGAFYHPAQQTLEYSNHDYDFSTLPPHSSCSQIYPNHIVDPIPTTGASSTADVSSTTNHISPMDIDPTSNMTSNGFIPPSLSEANDFTDLFDTECNIVSNVMCNSERDNPLLQAHTQVQLAQQVQNVQQAINQQNQIAVAAAVAQVAQMTAPSAMSNNFNTMNGPIATLPMIGSGSTNILNNSTTQLSTVMPPLFPKVASPNTANLLSQLEQTTSDMITVPREMIMKLIQNSNLRSRQCTCTCQCGRYPLGTNIAEEVSKNIILGGCSINTMQNDTKEEAKLETAEDMQLNGLLPADDSSVQWLNSAPPTVDPSSLPSNEDIPRRDSVFNPMLIDSSISDNEIKAFSGAERERLEEINAVANRWIKDGLDSYSLIQIIDKKGIKLVVNGLKMLTPFRFLSKKDKKELVRSGVYVYCVVKWIQHHESISLDGIDERVADHLSTLLEVDTGNYRVQPGTFNTLAVMLFFDVSENEKLSSMVRKEKEDYSKLLHKVISANNHCITESPQIFDLIPQVHNAATLLQTLTGGVTDYFLGTIL